MVGRALAAVLAGTVLAIAGPASADPAVFDVDRLLRMEAIGTVRASPDGRWIVVERQSPYDGASRYDYDGFSPIGVTDLVIHDAGAGGPTRIVGADDPAGYKSGPISPDSARMAIYRLDGRRWDLGVLELATGHATWLDVTPDVSGLGRTFAWDGPEALAVTTLPNDQLPLLLRLGWQAQARTATRWRDQARGTVPSVSVAISGAERDARAQAAEKQLLRIDLADGERRLLFEGEVVDFEMASDRRVAVLTDEEDLQPATVDPVQVATSTRRRRLHLIEPDGEVREPLAGMDVGPLLLSFSDNGDLLAFARSPGHSWEAADLWRIDAGTRSPRRLTSERLRPALQHGGDGMAYIRAVWGGDDVLVFASLVEGSSQWFRLPPDGRSEALGGDPGARPVMMDGDLWQPDAPTARRLAGVQTLPDGARLQDPDTAPDAAARELLNPGSRLEPGAALLDFHGCLAPLQWPWRFACPVGDKNTGRTIVANAAGGYLVSRREEADGVGRLLLRTPRSESALVTVNTDLTEVAWGEIRAVPHAGLRGALTSWLLLPPAPQAGPPPVVALIYPGEVHATAPASLRPGSSRRQISPQVLAAAGYAVLIPSLPTRDEAGLDRLAEDVWRAIDAAGALGLVDPGRAAIAGHSFGGHGALRAITQTDRFRAAVVTSGEADLASATRVPPHFLANPEDGIMVIPTAGWTETGQAAMGGPAWSRPDQYVAASPLYQAGRIRTPVLLVQGDQDPSSADSLFAALYRIDRDATLLTYWGEAHQLVSPANIRDFHQRLIDWLDLKLAPLEPGLSGGLLPISHPDLDDGVGERDIEVSGPDQRLDGQQVIERFPPP